MNALDLLAPEQDTPADLACYQWLNALLAGNREAAAWWHAEMERLDAMTHPTHEFPADAWRCVRCGCTTNSLAAQVRCEPPDDGRRADEPPVARDAMNDVGMVF